MLVKGTVSRDKPAFVNRNGKIYAGLVKGRGWFSDVLHVLKKFV